MNFGIQFCSLNFGFIRTISIKSVQKCRSVITASRNIFDKISAHGQHQTTYSLHQATSWLTNESKFYLAYVYQNFFFLDELLNLNVTSSKVLHHKLTYGCTYKIEPLWPLHPVQHQEQFQEYNPFLSHLRMPSVI